MPSRATSDSPKTVDTSSTKRKRRSDADATDKRTRTSDRFRGQFIVYRACWTLLMITRAQQYTTTEHRKEFQHADG